MAIALRVAEITEDQKTITPLALPLADPLGANITTGMVNIYSSGDGKHHAGFWETAVGRSRWDFTDGGEVIYILDGAMTIERDGEAPRNVKKGDLVVFEPGWAGFWTVTEHLKKVYTMFG